jgi:Sec-independent protein translocase protein TatA
VAKSLGKVVGSARKYLKDITEEVKEEMKDVTEDLKDVKEELKGELKEVENALKEPLKDGQKALAAGSEAAAGSRSRNSFRRGSSHGRRYPRGSGFRDLTDRMITSQHIQAGGTHYVQ